MIRGQPGFRASLFRFYEHHRRTFWALHSPWALATGAVVVLLAHMAYGYAARVMYRETPFFILPFYVYSTTLASPNVLFLAYSKLRT